MYQVIEKLITENGVDIFYTGGMGQFDEQFTNAVRKAKLKYNHISIVLIKPYFSNELNTNKEYYNYRYDDVMICEESELVHPKAAIKKRNRWMVADENSVFETGLVELIDLQSALKVLTSNERGIIDALYLSANPKTEREYSKEINVPCMTLHCRKTKILKKLKNYFVQN